MRFFVSLDEQIDRVEQRFGRRRTLMLGLLLSTAIVSFALLVLLRTDFRGTALVYLGIPYAVAVLITLFRPYQKYDEWWARYFSHALSALVVFLASSVVLFEGFICVLFFMPIYFLGVTLAFIASWISAASRARKHRIRASIIPLIVVFLSFEGTSSVTTFDRTNAATAVVTTSLSPAELANNLATPFKLSDSKNWMLSLFPMPYQIDAGSLRPGDVHQIHTRYHRWLVANTHEGSIDLRIDSVTPDRIVSSFIRDTSYFSTYVRLISSDIRFSETESGATQVSLTIHYERRLDPIWYFQPIQQYAMKTMASHLIEEVMIRDE